MKMIANVDVNVVGKSLPYFPRYCSNSM